MEVIAAAVTTLAAAAQAAGVTHVRLRRGPVAELVVLPAAAELPEATPEDKVKARERELFGEKYDGL